MVNIKIMNGSELLLSYIGPEDSGASAAMRVIHAMVTRGPNQSNINIQIQRDR